MKGRADQRVSTYRASPQSGTTRMDELWRSWIPRLSSFKHISKSLQSPDPSPAAHGGTWAVSQPGEFWQWTRDADEW